MLQVYIISWSMPVLLWGRMSRVWRTFHVSAALPYRNNQISGMAGRPLIQDETLPVLPLSLYLLSTVPAVQSTRTRMCCLKSHLLHAAAYVNAIDSMS